MENNIEKQAKKMYDRVFSTIEDLLSIKQSYTFADLQNLYLKLKKKEARNAALNTIPLINKMIVHRPIKSKYILKIAQLMSSRQISYMDKSFLEFLKTNKYHIYYMYFKEDYENEIKSINYNNSAYDALFQVENNDEQVIID